LDTLSHTGDPSSGKNEAPTVDAQTYKDLMEMVLTAALKIPSKLDQTDDVTRNAAENLLNGLQALMPEIEKYSPERAVLLRRKGAEFNEMLDVSARFYNENAELLEKGSVDDLLEAARRAPQEMRYELLSQAANRALEGGDVERARRIVNDGFSTSYERKQALANLDQQLFWRAANEGKVNEARLMLSHIGAGVDRTSMLTHLAAVVAGKGDKRGALELLDEARALVGNRAENYNQLQSQLTVARAFASLEPARAFEMLEAVVGRFNDLTAAAEVMNGFEQQYYKDGELTWQSTLSSMIHQLLFELSALARTDFDRAQALADKFERLEVRVMAHLLITQGVLADAYSGGARGFGSRVTVMRSGG
jgi:hypothetical protein